MSKVCPKCRSINCIVEIGKTIGGAPWFICLHCHYEMWKEDILPVTLFHRITVSPEVLAEKLVYQGLDGDFHSSIIEGGTRSFPYEDEAIVATVNKLKEVEG